MESEFTYVHDKLRLVINVCLLCDCCVSDCIYCSSEGVNFLLAADLTCGILTSSNSGQLAS